MHNSEAISKPIGRELYLVVAIATALIVLATVAKSKARQRQLEKNEKKVSVVYVIKDVLPGAMLTGSMVEQKEVMLSRAPLSVRMKAEDVVGKKSKNALYAGELLDKDILSLSSRTVVVALSEVAQERLENLADKKGISLTRLVKQIISERISDHVRLEPGK